MTPRADGTTPSTAPRIVRRVVGRSRAASRSRSRSALAVLAQRFRVYQRRGYYRAGLEADRDAYDTNAAYFLAVLPDAGLGDALLGSARVIVGESRADFRFPAEEAFELELPPAVRETPIAQRIEVSRVVAEAVHGIVIGGLLTPLGLLQAIGAYARPHGARSGLAVIKQRLLRALQRVGVALHEIQPACVIDPTDDPLSGYFSHSDPVVPVYWLTDQIGPSIERAIARYRGAGG